MFVNHDEVADVVDVRFFGFETEMFQPNGFSNLIEQTRWLKLRHGIVMDKSGIPGVIYQK